MRARVVAGLAVLVLAGCGAGGPDRTTYTTDDGLAGNEVTSVTIAGDGTVWAGTAGGVVAVRR